MDADFYRPLAADVPRVSRGCPRCGHAHGHGERDEHTTTTVRNVADPRTSHPQLESLAHDLLPDSKSSSASSTVGNSEESKEAATPNGSSEERKEAIGPNDSTSSTNVNGNADAEIDANHAERRVLIKKLRKLVLLGAGCGLGIAFIIGAIFLAVFYTQSNDLCV